MKFPLCMKEGMRCSHNRSHISFPQVISPCNQRAWVLFPLGVNIFSKFYNPNLHNIARSDRIVFKTKNPNRFSPQTQRFVHPPSRKSWIRHCWWKNCVQYFCQLLSKRSFARSTVWEMKYHSVTKKIYISFAPAPVF